MWAVLMRMSIEHCMYKPRISARGTRAAVCMRPQTVSA